MNIELAEVKEDVSRFGESVHENSAKLDYKMVTFSLGGKDYGIDIMKVKEIAKFGQFTYVPNSPPFVEGVYNLRGDIISIIDLRVFFNLPLDEKPVNGKNGLILRLNDYIIGIVVDSIDKVVSISSDTIQPPHPIFGDININYIEGVVEDEERLYIILDAEKIFGIEEFPQNENVENFPDADQAVPTSVQAPSAGESVSQKEKDFVAETLAAFKSFYVTKINSQWYNKRFDQWKTERTRTGKELQLKTQDEAEEFLRSFISDFSERFWSDEYAASFSELFRTFFRKDREYLESRLRKGF